MGHPAPATSKIDVQCHARLSCVEGVVQEKCRAISMCVKFGGCSYTNDLRTVQQGQGVTDQQVSPVSGALHFQASPLGGGAV